MSKLTDAERNKLDNTCGNLRITKLGTHVKSLEDFVNERTLDTNANTVAEAINELYHMFVNKDCSSIQIPPPGFFTLFGDDETGKLYCYYNDRDHPPVFRHVEDKNAADYGSLYLYVADPDGDNHYELKVGEYLSVSHLNDYYTKSEIIDLLSNIDGTIEGSFANKDHDHGNINKDGVISGKASKNVVTDANGKITTEDKLTVDTAFSASSTKPVQNKVIQSALGGKVDKVTGKGLSSNDFTDALKSKLDAIDAQANKTIVDTAFSASSTNPVQNKVIKSALDGINDNILNLQQAYYKNSLRIKIGRWSDNQGEDGTKIEVDVGSGNGVYAKLYCDDPNYSLNNRDIIMVLNGIAYTRPTDSNGKTEKLTINYTELGDYLLTAFVRGSDGMYPATDQKIIRVK